MVSLKLNDQKKMVNEAFEIGMHHLRYQIR